MSTQNQQRELARRLISNRLYSLTLAELSAIGLVLEELHSAKRMWPQWPSDQIHAAAIVAEESGELVKSVNDYTFKAGPFEPARNEAVQVGAMAIRFIANAPFEAPNGKLVNGNGEREETSLEPAPFDQ